MLERERTALSPVRLTAWQLMLAAKRARPSTDTGYAWYVAARRIKQGEAGYHAQHLVATILRPRLEVRAPVLLREAMSHKEPEALHRLLWIEFCSERHPPPAEILQAWPEVVDQEVALFLVLERTLLDALEEARDVGFLERPDRTSWDVPSVAMHPQNAHRSGFYPVTRALADIWECIASKNHERANRLALSWRDLPHLLTQRLYLYALAMQDIFTAREAALGVLALSHDVFWLSGAQVEIMRLLVGRWHEFSDEDRDALEARLAGGMPRDLFPADAFEAEEEWESIRDSAVFKRLNRISAAGCELSAETLQLLRQISARHPKWEPGPGDRDDFMTWMGEGRHGLDGHPELLADIADENILNEAMRLQREMPIEEGDIWRRLCLADPDRALRVLCLEGAGGNWNFEAWQSFLWEANEKATVEIQFALADLLLEMPDAALD